jgi:hypothetical protein
MPADIKYNKPGFFLTKVLNPLLILTGLLPVLSVKGRKSGKIIRTPVSPITFEDHEYLVAPRGMTQWARNLRNAGNGQLTASGKTKDFKAEEIKGSLRENVISVYRKKIKYPEKEFELLPDPSDHPVFRLVY